LLKDKATLARFLSLAVLAMIAVSLLVPATALAASHPKRPHNPWQHHKTRFMRPHTKHQSSKSGGSGGGSNLQYNGGPVMENSTQVYAIFWEPRGSSVSPTYNTLIERYFNDVGNSGLYNNNTQYSDSSGAVPNFAFLAGSWVDDYPYPSNTLQDVDIQNEVTYAQLINNWTPGPTHIFFVYTAFGENICYGSACSFTTFCAYHSFFTDPSGNTSIYAAMPYTGTSLAGCGTSTSPNNDFDADSTINVSSHEQMEAATDPLLNAWYDPNDGSEIGDKCAWNFGVDRASNGANVQWSGDFYIVQQEWDNLVSDCTLSGPLPRRHS
jgi:hypothetical protein